MKLKQVDFKEQEFALRYLHRETLPLDDMEEHGENDIWVILYDLTLPVAFGCIRPLPKAEDGSQNWYLSRVGVLDRYRGKRIQARIMRYLCSTVKKMGVKRVVSDCTTENVASANSFIRCGWKVFDPIYRWGLPTAIYWEKEL